MPIGYLLAALMLAGAGSQAAGNQADAVGKKFRAQIVVEAGLSVPSSIEAAQKATTIEKALDAIVAATAGSAWRRLHVQVPAGKPLPAVRTLAERVRTIEAQTGANLVIERPDGSRATVLMANYSVTPTYRTELQKAQYRTIYLLYSIKPPRETAPKPAAEDRPVADESPVVDVFGDMLGTFFALDQNSQQAGMQQAMSLLQTLDPASRADFVTTMWRSMSPELQADVVRSVMRFEKVRRRGPQ